MTGVLRSPGSLALLHVRVEADEARAPDSPQSSQHWEAAEVGRSLSRGTHACQDDDDRAIQHHGAAHFCDFFVAYSPSFGVPVLYFTEVDAGLCSNSHFVLDSARRTARPTG